MYGVGGVEMGRLAAVYDPPLRVRREGTKAGGGSPPSAAPAS